MSTFEDLIETSFIEHEGARIRVVQAGKGPDVVWIPGGDSPVEFWAGQFVHFNGLCRSTSFDPRGAGETTNPPPPWTMAQYARDCAAVIEHCCSAPVTLVCLSMGSLIAQQTAIDFPDLVGRVIAMGTAAEITGFTRDWMEAEIAFMSSGIQLPADYFAAHYAPFCYPATALSDDALWAKVKAQFGGRNDSRDPVMKAAQWRSCLDFDCSQGLKTCLVPIDAVAFDQDVQTPPALVRRVAALAPNGRYHELPGLGHVSIRDHDPQTINAFLEKLLAED